MASTVKWCKESFIHIPTIIKPRSSAPEINVEMTTKFSQTGRYAAHSVIAIVALVLHLLLLGGPAAVSWLVISFAVNTIQGGSFRSVSHIGVEICKAVLPSITNRDPLTSVIGVVFTFGIKGPVSHVSPGTVGTGMPLAVGFTSAMNATVRSSTPQSGVGNLDLASTLANAYAELVVSSWRSVRNHFELAEGLADQGRCFSWHNIRSIIVVSSRRLLFYREPFAFSSYALPSTLKALSHHDHAAVIGPLFAQARGHFSHET